ncbi:hypothetical protein [Dictyobacter aurantiacus]|uniref:Uncharacterized protein n=1 Tax=Dictyobacter aurantiacus TaxID=1936993 RepID=A0A401ZPU5_9CHLR|nr:hypothetical protein [Dictyobacter aurantiacus]GCE08893.1 hypothetical protein KDAU_62220 [Dictyobacter aurantiacus]
MRTPTKPKRSVGPDTSLKRKRQKRFSPLMLIGISVPLLVIIVAGIIFVVPRINSHAANVNADCTLIVPPNPLSAQGLATPYQLVATDPNAGPCNEANAGQAAFVQGAVINPRNGQISIYNPLVVDKGTQPTAKPVVPNLPANGVVALWFGFNGNNLTLKGMNNSLAAGRCTNGNNNSIFGQFAYCNAREFFAVANFAIRRGQLQVPALGTAADGMPCPTVRDFSVIDMDQSDNVTTTYLVTANGIAQNNAANLAAMQNAQAQTNASDNRLLSVALDGALNCQPWTAPDLADNGKMVPALPLNELQAAAHPPTPMAVVPLGDPMVLNNGNHDQNKVNLYRRGVDQKLIGQGGDNGNTITYCKNYLNIAPARIQLDAQFTKNKPSPDPAAANSLFTFLAQRFNAGFGDGGLNCAKLLNMQSPIKVTTDGNGVAIDATINLGNGGNTGAPNCSVNGTVINGCTGTTTINNQTCQVSFDKATNQVNINCGGNQTQPGQNQPTPVPPTQQTPVPQGQPTPTPQVQPTQPGQSQMTPTPQGQQTPTAQNSQPQGQQQSSTTTTTGTTTQTTQAQNQQVPTSTAVQTQSLQIPANAATQTQTQQQTTTNTTQMSTEGTTTTSHKQMLKMN